MTKLISLAVPLLPACRWQNKTMFPQNNSAALQHGAAEFLF